MARLLQRDCAMSRTIATALSFLMLLLLATSVEAAPLTRQQKSAATRAYTALAKKQFGPAAKVTVKYSGKNLRQADIRVTGVGGLTGQQPNAFLGSGRGRVVVHQKQAIVRKQGKIDVSLEGGRFNRVLSLTGR